MMLFPRKFENNVQDQDLFFFTFEQCSLTNNTLFFYISQDHYCTIEKWPHNQCKHVHFLTFSPTCYQFIILHSAKRIVQEDCMTSSRTAFTWRSFSACSISSASLSLSRPGLHKNEQKSHACFNTNSISKWHSYSFSTLHNYACDKRKLELNQDKIEQIGTHLYLAKRIDSFFILQKHLLFSFQPHYHLIMHKGIGIHSFFWYLPTLSDFQLSNELLKFCGTTIAISTY